MAENMENVRRYYDANSGAAWARLAQDRYHEIEYRVTVHYLTKHVEPPPAHFLDIGCGPGRYALDLARCGYDVSLVDVSEAMLRTAQSAITDAGLGRNVRQILHASATDIGALPDAAYDAVLLLGPLYHLTDAADRAAAVAETYRVLKPGGVVAASFIGRYMALRDALALAPHEIGSRAAELQQWRKDGIYRSGGDGSANRFTDAYFTRPADIGPLMAAGGFRQLDLVACESFAVGMEAEVNALDDALFERWLALLTEAAADPDLIGNAEHVLYLGRK